MWPKRWRCCRNGAATESAWRATTSSLLPLATERTRAAIAAYRGNAGTLTAVLDARRAEIDTRVERLRWKWARRACGRN
jgi:outer membrane protein TolC